MDKQLDWQREPPTIPRLLCWPSWSRPSKPFHFLMGGSLLLHKPPHQQRSTLSLRLPRLRLSRHLGSPTSTLLSWPSIWLQPFKTSAARSLPIRFKRYLVRIEKQLYLIRMVRFKVSLAIQIKPLMGCLNPISAR